MDSRVRAVLPVALLLLTALAAGCTTGGPSYVKTKFQDADQRIAQSADGGYSQFWQIVVPPAAPALTIRSSFLADQGIAFSLRNPGNRVTTSFTYPAATEVPEMTWMEVRKPTPGTWRLGIECGRRCDFSFGFYLKDAMPTEDRSLPDYPDATVRFSEETEASASRVNAFRIPSGATHLKLGFSLDTEDQFSFRLEDPAGNARASTSFPARATVDEATYAVMDDPTPGTWTFRAECRTACAYALGVYVE